MLWFVLLLRGPRTLTTEGPCAARRARSPRFRDPAPAEDAARPCDD